MVFPGNSIFLKMKGLCDVSIAPRWAGSDLRVVVDGVDTVPLLEDHDHALEELAVDLKSDRVRESLTATLVRLKSDLFVRSDR